MNLSKDDLVLIDAGLEALNRKGLARVDSARVLSISQLISAELKSKVEAEGEEVAE